MIVQYGDKISLDIDNWGIVNRLLTVIACKERPNSTAVELIVEDPVDEQVFKCVVAKNQIIKETNIEVD